MYCHQVKHTLARGWQPLRTRELGRQVADAVLAADHVGLLFLASGFQRRGLGGAVGQRRQALARGGDGGARRAELGRQLGSFFLLGAERLALLRQLLRQVLGARVRLLRLCVRARLREGKR